MDKLTMTLSALAGLWLLTSYLRNSKPIPNVKKIKAEEAKTLLDGDKGIVLLDVRTKEENKSKRIAKSVLIPVNNISKQVEKKVPNKDSKVIVYCRSGSRSRMAARILSSMGYTNIYDLGSINNWPYGTVKG